MLISSIGYLLQSPATEPEGQEGEVSISEYIIHHITDRGMIHLPTIFGIDFSITYHVLMMWIAAAFLLFLMLRAFSGRQLIPGRLGNMFEAVIVFLRKDVVVPYLRKESKRFESYLYTVFFFVLFCNLIGMFPGGATPTSNIAVTGTLAVMTFLLGIYAGVKAHGPFGYFKGFIPSGVPTIIVPLIAVLEIFGMIIRHFVLAVRLLANMTAGHVIIFAFVGLIFMFKSYLIAVLPALGIVAIGLLELLVAFIQAYVFMLLSAVFIGAAIHHDH